MSDHEFKAMLSKLGFAQQVYVGWRVFWRWLFRPRRVSRDERTNPPPKDQLTIMGIRASA
jgi:hypothetical protein